MSIESKADGKHQQFQHNHYFQLVTVDDGSYFEAMKAVLKGRIPISANIYNMSLMYPRFLERMNFYVFQQGSHNNCTAAVEVLTGSWIFALYNRADYGLEISISGPPNTKIPPELETALADPLVSLIDWKMPYEFASLDHYISGTIIKLTKHSPNTLPFGVYLCNHYIVTDRTQMTKLPYPKEIELKPLTLKNGPKLLYDTWSYSKEGTEIVCKDFITKGITSAVYINNNPISWDCLHQCGHLGPLYTLEQYRGKNYAVFCLQDLIYKLPNEFIACAMADIGNDASNSVHKKPCMEFTHLVDFIIYGR